MADDRQLLTLAQQVRQRAHAPYSGFLVGAALVDDKGNIHVGCNVENAAYPEGSCAEPNAIGAMIASGGTRIVRILVVGGIGDLIACTPCGGCRQHISEFADDKTRIVSLDNDGELVEHTIEQLLPGSFSL
ncbi:MAG: cytidine deaminase [Gammaproteobacteria bacterium]|nr:cytidine deaminase [Gammaproteobacteria bacterium]MDH3768333.1 cytidine deaminase [Gammaproteobacteria bacterium]